MSRGPHTPDAMIEHGTLGRLVEDARAPSAPEDRSDDDLVRGVLGGEQRCFELLLQRHEATVVRVLRLLGVPARDREDVAQEVFLRVFRYLGGFRPGRPFSGWIYRISVNAAHDYRGRVGRRREEAEWPEEPVDGTLRALTDPAGRPGDPDLKRLLERALGELSERERAVFVLRELEGLSTRDVARSLGITGITVRRHLGRARRSLQEYLSRVLSPGGRR